MGGGLSCACRAASRRHAVRERGVTRRPPSPRGGRAIPPLQGGTRRGDASEPNAAAWRAGIYPRPARLRAVTRSGGGGGIQLSGCDLDANGQVASALAVLHELQVLCAGRVCQSRGTRGNQTRHNLLATNLPGPSRNTASKSTSRLRTKKKLQHGIPTTVCNYFQPALQVVADGIGVPELNSQHIHIL